MPAKQPIRTSTATITVNGQTVQATAASRLEALAQAVELLAAASK